MLLFNFRLLFHSPRTMSGLSVGCPLLRSWQWKRFLHNWPFVREIQRSTVDSPHESLSNAGHWCFLWCQHEQTMWQTDVLLVIWYAMMLLWLHCNDCDIMSLACMISYHCLIYLDDLEKNIVNSCIELKTLYRQYTLGMWKTYDTSYPFILIVIPPDDQRDQGLFNRG